MSNTNTKHGFGSAGLIIVILIIIAGGAYLWSQKKAEAPAPTNVPADNSFKTLPAPTVDTSNWKTYSKPKSKFNDMTYSFSYPSSWVLDDSKVTPIDQYASSLVFLTKEDHKLEFDIPSGWDGEICEFTANSNQPTVNGITSIKFPNHYVEIISPSDIFRRWVEPRFIEERNTNIWTICKKEKASNLFGTALVRYWAPANFNYKIISEMDDILRTSVGVL